MRETPVAVAAGFFLIWDVRSATAGFAKSHTPTPWVRKCAGYINDEPDEAKTMTATTPDTLKAFKITDRWPPQHPDRLQLYSYPTPNGQKASIMLEEIGLPYEAHKVTVKDVDVKSPEFLSLSPNNKIPAMIDPDGPGGKPLPLFESGAILIYLAEKSGQLLGHDVTERHQIIQWLMWQMGGVGPMFGQLGFFYKLGGAKIEDERPRKRYIDETTRLLTVLNTALDGQDWIAGEYSIADIAIAPWLNALDFYGAKEVVGFNNFGRVAGYLERFNDRPAVQRGRAIPATD